MIFLPTIATAEARIFGKGETINYERWLEDARVDPLRLFVYFEGLNRHNKCTNQHDVGSVELFFERFNELVEAKIFDFKHVEIVWVMRECLPNEVVAEIVDVSDNTFLHRLKAIRSEMGAFYD